MSLQTPRRLADETIVGVVLQSCVSGSEFVSNTWVLIGLDEPFTNHTQTVVQMSCAHFRKQLAYVDDHLQLYMDATGDHVDLDNNSDHSALTGPSTQITLFRVGDIRIGEYRLNLNRRHCSCKSYQYLRTERKDRNCKHLNSICRPSYLVVYTKQKQFFQLISETVPAKPSTYMNWIYSQKHDGIRVCVRGTDAWTRGGMKIDLSSIWTPPVGHDYDAELCAIGADTSTHNHDFVMSCILAGKIALMRLLVFDMFDPTGLLTCGQRLFSLWGLSIPDQYLVRYQMVHLRGGPSFQVRLALLGIGSTQCEGVIVRNPDALYDGSGKRTNQSIFKVKSIQWSRLLRDGASIHYRWL